MFLFLYSIQVAFKLLMICTFVDSIRRGIEYIKNLTENQFAEQDMVEALQHTNENPQDAVDYLLRKGIKHFS